MIQLIRHMAIYLHSNFLEVIQMRVSCSQARIVRLPKNIIQNIFSVISNINILQ